MSVLLPILLPPEAIAWYVEVLTVLFDGLAPYMVWATTQDWYLAVEYNLHSTYIGGPTTLIDSIINAGNFETYEALSGDNFFKCTTKLTCLLPQRYH